MKKSFLNFKQYTLNEDMLDKSCPLSTRNIELNTKNRDAAIKSEIINYGPMNLTDKQYWVDLADHWSNKNRKTTPEVAKESKCKNCAAFDISERMKECMPGEIDKDGYLGYCWMHKFKCHSERTCYTWAAGGPIDTDETSLDWESRNKEQ